MAQETYERQVDAAPEVRTSEITHHNRFFTPQVDILEDKDHLVLLADMPGVDAQSVDISIEENILTITGAVRRSDAGNRRLLYSEHDEGDYQRSFVVSEEIDRERIDASVKNGVLRLTLPKLNQAQTRKIDVKAA